MTSIYTDNTYLENNPSWHIEDSEWKAKQIHKLIENNQLNINSVCEIGCGAGGILYALKRHLPEGCRFYGYEVSPQAFELCQARSPNETLTFTFGDVFEEKDKSFDLIMAIDVIEHVENNFEFVRKMREKAQYKIFHIPLDLSVFSVLRPNALLSTRKKVGHIHYYTKSLALALLEENGYQIIDWFYTYGAVDLAGGGLKRTLAKYPRKLAYMLSKDFAANVLGGASIMVLAR